jgi:hypothetical protein
MVMLYDPGLVKAVEGVNVNVFVSPAFMVVALSATETGA